jgi:SAM-dependent methyltransferase
MSALFSSYARYYDTVYREKDYRRECDELESTILRWSGLVHCRILDAGCGTGTHAQIFGQRGHRVLGVDRSEQMLDVARRKVDSSAGAVEFVAGDLTNLDLAQKFDAVTCLFGVISYQLENEEVASTLSSFRRHLDVGGLLMMDFWSGGGVLTEGPSRRKIELLCDDGTRVVRIAKPLGMNFATQTNTTEYTITHLAGSCVIEEFTEKHRVRYFFPQEIRHYVQESGFDVLQLAADWASGGELEKGNWVGVLVARAV